MSRIGWWVDPVYCIRYTRGATCAWLARRCPQRRREVSEKGRGWRYWRCWTPVSPPRAPSGWMLPPVWSLLTGWRAFLRDWEGWQIVWSKGSYRRWRRVWRIGVRGCRSQCWWWRTPRSSLGACASRGARRTSAFSRLVGCWYFWSSWQACRRRGPLWWGWINNKQLTIIRHKNVVEYFMSVRIYKYCLQWLYVCNVYSGINVRFYTYCANFSSNFHCR